MSHPKAISDHEYIAKQQKKADSNLLRQLRLVQNDPLAIGRKTIETLLVNNLIEFGGPSEACQYNHHRLTTLGVETLQKLAK